MKKFDIHAWRHKQLIESYTINQNKKDPAYILTELFMDNLTQNKLYENISSQEYNLIRENLLKKLKTKFLDFSNDVKSNVKNIVSKLGKEGLSSLQKIASKFPKFTKSSDLLLRVKIAQNLPSIEKFIEKVKSIKEQETEKYPTISNTNELQNIKPESGFIWGGETDNSYKFNGAEIVNGDNEGEGLIRGTHYMVFPEMEYTDEKGNIKKTKTSIAGFGKLKEIVDGESEGFLIDLNEWLKKYKLNYVFAALGIFSAIGGVTAASAAAASDIINVMDTDPTGAANQGELTMGTDNIPTDFKADAENEVQGIETPGAPTTDSGEINKDLKDKGVDIKIDLTDDATTATEIITHDSGEYDKTDAEKQEASKSLVEKILSDINDILEPQEGQNLESINLTINYGGSISYQGGANSDVANDNTGLLDGRTNTGKDIANLAVEDITRIIADQYGQEFADNNLNIELNEVNTEGGIENQVVQQTGDDLSTQSSFMSIKINDVKTGDTGEPITLLQYQFAAITPDQSKTLPFTPPPIESFGNLIREGQITVIMALIKPEVEIFPYLNAIRHDKNSNEAIGRYEQSDWLQVRDNDSMPEESRTLAGAIINARKRPDTLTSRIAKCLGIELSKRALAKATPGPAGIGMELVGWQDIRERIHPLYELLGEAVIDKFIDCNNVNKNAGQLLAYIGSMYASKDNTQIGIVNIGNLPSNIKSQLDKSGFSQTSMGRDKGIYVFLDKGTPDNISEPISLDPNIQVAKDKGAIPSSKLDIDSPSVKKGKIFISPKDVPAFPKDIYKTEFYKDAVKDGWIFVDRKNASSLPKGTKVKTLKFNLNNLKNIDYSKNKKLATLLERINSLKKI